MIYCPHCTKPTSYQTGKCRHCGKDIPESVISKATANQAKKPAGAASAQTGKAPHRRLRLGETLVGAGLLTTEQLQWALAKQKEMGGRLGTLLVERELISEAHLIQALSHQGNLSWIDLRSLQIDDDVLINLLKLIPLSLAEKHMMFPLDVRKLEDGRHILFLAMDDPSDTKAIAAAQAGAGMQIKPLFATPSAITATLHFYRGKLEVVTPVPRGTDRWSFPAAENGKKPEQQKAEAEKPTSPKKTRKLTLPDSIIPVLPREDLKAGGGGKMLTLLDGTTIPWANETQKGFVEEGTGIEFFEELISLGEDPDGIIRTRQYVAAMLRIMFKEKIIAPERFAIELEKFSLDPQE